MTRAKKSLGQHFLTDERIASQIVQLVSPRADDLILEIGPGKGALTGLLAERSVRVVAVEVDSDLASGLSRRITTRNVRVINEDALTLDWKGLVSSLVCESPGRVRVVANLPYNISTAIIRRLIRLGPSLFDMTLMLQEEVVDRIVSPPGGKQYGYLSVLVQYRCSARKVLRVPPSAFRPRPKVWSAVVKLDVREAPAIKVKDEDYFFTFVRSSFSQRRKTILNNLRFSLKEVRTTESIEAALVAAGLEFRRRPETLSLEEFASLYRSLQFEDREGAPILV